MKTYGGSGCIDLYFLDLSTSWSDQLHAPAAVSVGKSPRYPLDRRLRGSHTRSGRRGEEKTVDPTGTRTPTPGVIQSVADRYTDCATPAPTNIYIQL
jgi:hypothetical protein